MAFHTCSFTKLNFALTWKNINIKIAAINLKLLKHINTYSCTTVPTIRPPGMIILDVIYKINYNAPAH